MGSGGSIDGFQAMSAPNGESLLSPMMTESWSVGKRPGAHMCNRGHP